jgi:hypothetical protein
MSRESGGFDEEVTAAMDLSGDLIQLFYSLWDQTLEGRQHILSADSPESLDRFPGEKRIEVHRALIYLNRIGHLVAVGPLDSEFVATLIGKEVIRVVRKAMPIIKNERDKRGDERYMEYVDHLLERCESAFPAYSPQYYSGGDTGLGYQV